MKKKDYIIISILAIICLVGIVSSSGSVTTDTVFTKLISNTVDIDHGTAIFEVCNPSDTSATFKSNKFNIHIDEYKGNPVKKIDYFYKTTENYNETITSMVCNPYTALNSSYMENCTKKYTVVQKTRDSWTLLDHKNDLPTGECVTIKIVGYWDAQPGRIKKEWIPDIEIKGIKYTQTKWAWWDADWTNCKTFTITETGNIYSTLNKPMEYNFTGLTKQVDNDDFRIVNADCNAGGTAQPYQVIDNGTDWVIALWSMNLTKNTAYTWSIYYNNADATSPGYSNITTYRETFEGNDYDHGYWTLSDNDPGNIQQASQSYSNYGIYSLQFYTSGGYYHRLNHVYSPGFTGTISFTMYEDGTIPTNTESGFLFTEADEDPYFRFPYLGGLSTSNYAVQDNDGNTQDGAKITTGKWVNCSVVTNASGSFAFINGLSVRNITRLVGLNTSRMQTSGVADTAYYDEYRTFANVYDIPDQRYTYALGNEQTYEPPVSVTDGATLTITRNSPANTSYIGNNTVFAQYLISKINVTVDKCWYKLDAGSNTTMTGCANTSITVGLGFHSLNLTVNGTNTTGAEFRNTTAVNFTINNTIPTITTQSPANTSYAYNTSVFNQFVVTHSGVDTIDKCWYRLDAETNVTSCNNASITALVGSHTLIRCANDTWDSIACSTIGFTIQPPTQELFITRNSPANTSYIGNNSIFAQYVVTKVNITADKCWYTIDSVANSTMVNCANTTISSLALGFHSLNLTVNGTLWNSTTEFRNTTAVNFTLINSAPSVAIQSPGNASYVYNASVALQFTVSHSGNDTVDKCWYKLDAESNVTSCNNATVGVTTLGFHTLNVCANDTYDAIGCTILTFTFTNTIPAVTQQSPANTSYAYNASIFNQFIVTHNGADAITGCWYKLDAESNVTGCNNVSLTVLVGAHTLITCSQDAFGVIGCATTGFTIRPPVQELKVTISSPGNASYQNISIFAQYLITKVNITADDCWYKLDNGANSSTNCANTSIGIGLLGDHELNITVNATAWNSTTELRNTSSVKFTITNDIPGVSIASPGNTSYTGNTSVFLQFLITHTGPDEVGGCWYKLNSNSNVTGCSNVTLSPLTLGFYNLTVCSIDDWGQIGCAYVNFSLINTIPTVSIQGLANTTYTGNHTINNQFTVTHTGVDTVDKCWYKLDTGSNVTSCLNSTISGMTLGFHTFTECANDTYDAIGCSQINFTIINAQPSVGITSITNTTYANTSIALNFVVTHTGADLIDKCWYKLDTEANVTGCNNVTLPVNISTHIIRACANDTWDSGYCAQQIFSIEIGVNIYAWDEETLVNISSFNATISDGLTYYQTGSTNSNVIKFNLTTNNSLTIMVSNTEYSTRTYYIPFSNTTINAYLLKTSSGLSQLFKTVNLYDNEVVGAVINVRKFISGSWITVAQGITDDTGTVGIALSPLINYNAIASKTGYINRTRTFTPSTSVVKFIFGAENIPNYLSWLSDRVKSNCTYTNTTYRDMACDVNDTAGIVVNTVMKAWQYSGITPTQICQNEDATAPYNLNCTFTNLNRTFYWTLSAVTDDGTFQLDSGWKQYTTIFNYGMMGLFVMLMMFIIIGFVGMWNPPIAIILSVLSLIIGYLLNFINFGEAGIGAVISIVLVGIVFAFKIKSD
jgi:hypothetical protein